MARIVIKNLTKTFDKGEVIAVKNLNLRVEDREILVLLGPSGCGKTTTLRCISGLELQDEGEIWIGDREVSDLEPKDRNVAVVFQNYGLFPHMNAYDNMAFGLKMKKVPTDEIKKRVIQAAEMLGIRHLLHRKPKQLSGGEQQRVALGRAIVMQPDAFLMDEPLANLDAKLRVKMRAEIKKLQRNLGVTMIHVTHDQEEALSLGDKIAIMNKGELQQVGKPIDVYEKPANKFVGGFIGSPSMNFIDCTLRQDKDILVFDAGEFKITLPKSEADLNITSPLEVILGVRPEAINVSREGGTIPAQIEIVEPLGDETFAHLRVKGGNIVVVARLPLQLDVREGEQVTINFDLRRIHVFDKKTEEKIL
jgi:multiple sugar transport system ATP-binding protein